MNPVDYLYFYAKFQPNDIAIRTAAGETTWLTLLQRVRRIAFKLRQEGLQPRHVALLFARCGVGLDRNPRAHSLGGHHMFGLFALPPALTANLLVTSSAAPPVGHDKGIIVGDDWLRELPPPPDDFQPQAYRDRSSPFRLVLTSGTTGQNKAAESSVAAFLKRCERMTPSTPYSTELCTMRFTGGIGFTLALRKLIRGLPSFYANTAKDVIGLVANYHVEALSGSPLQLGTLATEIQRSSRRLSSLKMVWYAGAEASSKVLDMLRRELCPTVACVYGSTEVGPISSFLIHDANHQPGTVGYVIPEVETQIVDLAQQPLAAGAEGLMRIKSSSMASGYYKDSEATLRSFRDGWFYSGDRGRFLASGMLELTGRESELVNRGGVKISPAEVDRAMQGYEGILDAATFDFENHLGFQDLCAAVVVSAGFNMENFQRHLQTALPSYQNPSMILTVKEIPRNHMGKAMRKELRAQFGDKLRQQLLATVGARAGGN